MLLLEKAWGSWGGGHLTQSLFLKGILLWRGGIWMGACLSWMEIYFAS